MFRQAQQNYYLFNSAKASRVYVHPPAGGRNKEKSRRTNIQWTFEPDAVQAKLWADDRHKWLITYIFLSGIREFP